MRILKMCKMRVKTRSMSQQIVSCSFLRLSSAQRRTQRWVARRTRLLSLIIMALQLKTRNLPLHQIRPKVRKKEELGNSYDLESRLVLLNKMERRSSFLLFWQPATASSPQARADRVSLRRITWHRVLRKKKAKHQRKKDAFSRKMDQKK